MAGHILVLGAMEMDGIIYLAYSQSVLRQAFSLMVEQQLLTYRGAAPVCAASGLQPVL